MSDVIATQIKLRQRSRLLEVHFDNGSCFELAFEYLRVHSPSAEVQGHGAGEMLLVLGKQNVGISAVEPIGQYAIRLVFDDGHNTGLFTWKYLYELGSQRDQKWAAYRARVERASPTPAAHGKNSFEQ